MPKSLADGRVKLAILSTKPADPMAPTVEELEAGIDASCNVLSSDYTLGATDSDKIAEKPLCQEGNSNAIGASNYQAALTPFRYFDDQGKAETTEDDVYQALKAKGTRVWLYERHTSKRSTESWAAGDEVDGFEVITDNPQKPSDMGGYIKRRVSMEVQDAWVGGAVAAAAGG
jgi:hypothetical protein